VYLWGCVLSSIPPSRPYTEEDFLISALRGLSEDGPTFSRHSDLVVQTIQAEIPLSYFYLYCARNTEGLYHSMAAVNLALEAGLHLLYYPSVTFVQTLLAPVLNKKEATTRVNVFWGAWILNNHWFAATGFPSVTTSFDINTPWP
ncbi:hypothetical protein C8R43DRAFT_856933, partial [Mycena crocata]